MNTKNAFVLVLALLVMFTGCAKKVVTGPPTAPIVIQSPAPQVPATATPIEAPKVTPQPAPAPAKTISTVPQQQTVVIGEIQTSATTKVETQVEIPTRLPSQPPSIMTDGQIMAAVPHIRAKLQSEPDRLARFDQQLMGVQGPTQRPQLEQLLDSYLAPGELAQLNVVEPMFTPNDVEIVRSVPDPQNYQELHLGQYPVTSGKPFTSPVEYFNDMENILNHLAKLNLRQDELEAAKNQFSHCFEGGSNFQQVNPLWKTGYCVWEKASFAPFVEQTTGGYNKEAGRETGVTKNIKCTDTSKDGCATAMIFGFFEPNFGRWYTFYNICRGNPAVPLQRHKLTFTGTRQEAVCRQLIPSVLDVVSPGQEITFRVDTTASPAGITNVQWTLNGEPFNGSSLQATLNERNLPRNSRSTVRFSAIGTFPSEPGVESLPTKMVCEATLTNRLPEIQPVPACTASRVVPSNISDPSQQVRFEVTIPATGRQYIPVVLKDGVEIYRGQPTSEFAGVTLAGLFTAAELATGRSVMHQLTFRAIDPETNQVLFECPGGAESQITFTPPPPPAPKECPCVGITGGDRVEPGKAVTLTVTRDKSGPAMGGYWRFQQDSRKESIASGDSFTLTYDFYEMKFGRPAKAGGEQAVIEYVNRDRDGVETVDPRCTKVITFVPPKPPKEETHHGFCGPHGRTCIIIGALVAAGVCAAKCRPDNRQKIDFGRHPNGITFVDEELTTTGKIWRFTEPFLWGPLNDFPEAKDHIKSGLKGIGTGTFHGLKFVFSH